MVVLAEQKPEIVVMQWSLKDIKIILIQTDKAHILDILYITGGRVTMWKKEIR